MPTVTYRGPKDPNDGTTEYQIGETVLPLGVAVPDVSASDAKQLKATEGHKFDVNTDKPEGK